MSSPNRRRIVPDAYRWIPSCTIVLGSEADAVM
jgi:hypothetical protein